MSDESFSIYELVEKDPRYPIEAYVFVREALAFASDSLELGSCQDDLHVAHLQNPQREQHLTGQELCEAIRQFALNQFGYMAQVVLGSWGIFDTGGFGDIVYNMIDAGLMKKSTNDRRAHFDDVFDFDEVFNDNFEICCGSIAQRRG